ncbi:MAG: sugar ABC transporter ATP-binding protein, partial [Mesorhizobium sp.]
PDGLSAIVSVLEPTGSETQIFAKLGKDPAGDGDDDLVQVPDIVSAVLLAAQALCRKSLNAS